MARKRTISGTVDELPNWRFKEHCITFYPKAELMRKKDFLPDSEHEKLTLLITLCVVADIVLVGWKSHQTRDFFQTRAIS